MLQFKKLYYSLFRSTTVANSLSLGLAVVFGLDATFIDGRPGLVGLASSSDESQELSSLFSSVIDDLYLASGDFFAATPDVNRAAGMGGLFGETGRPFDDLLSYLRKSFNRSLNL